MLNKIKIGPKLIGGFLIVSLIAAIIGIIGVSNINKINKADTFMYEKATLPLAYLITMAANFQERRVDIMKIAYLSETDKDVEFYENSILDLNKESAKVEGKYKEALNNDADILQFQQYLDSDKIYMAGVDNIYNLMKENKKVEARNNIPALAKVGAERTDLINKMIITNTSSAKQISITNTTSAKATSGFMIIILILGMFFSLIFGIFLSLSITRPINDSAQLVKAISDGDLNLVVQENYLKRGDEIGMLASEYKKMIGALKEKSDVVERIVENDLTVEVKVASEKDTLGKSIVSMTSSLNAIMSQINNSVEQTASGASQVAQASQSLSQGATEQASSLEEITSSITEINSQAKQNSENALQATSLAKKTMENSKLGNKQMKELVSSMINITKSAEEIKKIVKVIDDIAFQTNLLALNANVEAARAGKYGKGFAVVAEEVRNLAGRSAVSVKETTAMVEEAVKNILAGNNLVEVTSKQLDEIADNANKVADLVEEIASASKEQTQGLEQINQGLGQIDQVTQSNTANAEESASAAEELSGQAEQLKAIVSQFKLSEKYIEQNTVKKSLNNFADKTEKQINNKKTLTRKESQPVNPKKILKLDDDDFGKF